MFANYFMRGWQAIRLKHLETYNWFTLNSLGNMENISFKNSFRKVVVNSLLHKLLSFPHLSRFNSVVFCYQCQFGRNLVSYQCQHQHKLVIYQCKTTGHDLVSSKRQYRHKLVIYQYQTTGHDLVSSKSQYRHKLVIYQYQTNEHDLNSYVLTRTKLLL